MIFPEKYRKQMPGYISQPGDDFGIFMIPSTKIAPTVYTRAMRVIASAGIPGSMDWEHVSVSIFGSTKTPSWGEMCFIKGLFWEPEDCVMQLHPPESEYINVHPGVLHLWRPTAEAIPRPPQVAV